MTILDPEVEGLLRAQVLFTAYFLKTFLFFILIFQLFSSLNYDFF